MQEHLLNAAGTAGAEVQRGVHVVDIKPGERPTVVVRNSKAEGGATGPLEEITARLVVAADGRHSLAQKWTGVAVAREPERMRISGAIFEGIPIQETTGFAAFNPEIGEAFYLTPQRDGHVRGWLMYPPHLDLQLHGEEVVSRFIAEAIRVGTPPALLAQAHAVTRVITYCGDYPRVIHPYKEGVVFIGDCAACDDPTFGEGMALALRDVRVLRDHLLATQDWDTAAHAYAKEHDEYFETVRILGNWYWSLLLETGPEADARRAKALSLIAQDDTRMFDLFGLGPEVPATETTRRRFFGEE
jgi:2-polyprenyl-6-methoxyphenol hydroxylase-like FAD-dependent oxidoreductase